MNSKLSVIANDNDSQARLQLAHRGHGPRHGGRHRRRGARRALRSGRL